MGEEQISVLIGRTRRHGSPLVDNFCLSVTRARSFRLSSFSRVTCRNNFAHTFREFLGSSCTLNWIYGLRRLRKFANPLLRAIATNDEIFMGTRFSHDACENDESRNDRDQMGIPVKVIYSRGWVPGG